MSAIGEVVEREEGVFEWTVKDFMSLLGENEQYLSPSFSFAGAHWCLGVWLSNRVKDEQSDRYIAASLGKVLGPPIELNVSIGLKTSKDKVAEQKHETCNFGKGIDAETWFQFLRRSQVVKEQSELAPSGNLTIVCRMKRPPSTEAKGTFTMSNVPNSATDVAIGEVAEVEAGVVEWTVRDFFSLPVRVGDRYVSPSFPLHGARWRFVMLPNGEKRHGSEGCIGVHFRRDSSGSPIQLSFSFGLKTSKGELAQETHATRYFGEQFDSFGCSCFLQRHVLRERKFELAPLGHLTWVWRTKRPPSIKFFSFVHII